MSTPKGWYNTIFQMHDQLKERKGSKDFHPLDDLLNEQAQILIQLYDDCEFVGFPKTDSEANEIVSNLMANVQTSLSDKMDFVPENPFFNLFLGLLYLEKVLKLIKQEYERNLNITIEYIEQIIYKSNDYQNLVEVSRNLGRNIINKKQHPEFGKLKQHIAEQLEYIERSNKAKNILPSQQIESGKETNRSTKKNVTDEINEKFIEDLRISRSIWNWAFEGVDDQKEQVPNVQTHEVLLSNFRIDESIRRYYFLPTSNSLSNEEFQKIGEGVLYPYSILINGAYFFRTDLVFKLADIAYSGRTIKIGDNIVENFSDLQPYFKDYASGFHNGFKEFDKNQINPFLTPFADRQDYVNKVFEYITTNIFPTRHGWISSTKGFCKRYKVKTNHSESEIVEGFEDGQMQGYFYRAWSIVFSSNNLFAPLFQEYFKTTQSPIIAKIEQRSAVKLGSNPFQDEYDGMFSVSANKSRFKLSNGHIRELNNTTEGTFDLEDKNLYDDQTGELIEVGRQSKYNSEFLIKMKKLYVLDVHNFLNHHLTHSKNQSKLTQYIKYVVLKGTTITSEVIRQATKDWLDEVENNNPKNSNAVVKNENIPELEESNLKLQIERAFGFMQGNDPRKHKLILKETEFENLINWICFYFENGFSLPEIKEPINEVNTNKGNVIYTFMKFFKELHPNKPRPDSLFQLIKNCFYEYREDDIKNYKKQKEPQYYSGLITK